MKQLLIETRYLKPTKTLLTEEMGKNCLMVECILTTVEQENGNGRYYKRDLWERELERYKSLVEQGSAFGELDHSDSPQVELKNTSHRITKFWWEGKDVYGRVLIMPTPSGNVAKAIIESGGTLGISSRGLGSLQENERGLMEVQDDFELVCWDFVSTPSNQSSWVKPLNESQIRTYNKYGNLHNIARRIMCNNGSCSL